jgi:hypothetical protein
VSFQANVVVIEGNERATHSSIKTADVGIGDDLCSDLAIFERYMKNISEVILQCPLANMCLPEFFWKFASQDPYA